MRNKQLGQLAVCGHNAVLALVAQHPERVQRLFFNREMAPELSQICKYMSARKKIYRLVDDGELAKLAKTEHHQGLVAMIDEEPVPSLSGADRGSQKDGAVALVLETLGNTHNIGAIVRSAAFFGVRRIYLLGMGDFRPYSTSAYRVAEGGMEHVEFWRIDSLDQLRGLEPAHCIIGTDHRAEMSLAQFRSIGLTQPPIFAFGNEESGLSPACRGQCDRLVKIEGTGAIESLNVAQAVAAVLAGWR